MLCKFSKNQSEWADIVCLLKIEWEFLTFLLLCFLFSENSGLSSFVFQNLGPLQIRVSIQLVYSGF